MVFIKSKKKNGVLVGNVSVPVTNNNAEETKEQIMSVSLPLNVTEHQHIVHRDLLRHQMSQKQGTSSTKTRSEVRGGGRKPWRQKGTGRARAGSNCSPLWKGGGVIFGPKPKTHNLKLNKKERKLAIAILLYDKQRQFSLTTDLESEVTEPNTKKFCENLSISKKDEKILIIVSKKTLPLKLSTRNVKNIELISASNLNTLILLKSKNNILITPSALNEIKELYL